MTIYVVVAIVATIATLFLLKTALDREVPVSKLTDLLRRSEPVDLQAFRNLVDSKEENYLRTNLPPREFRMVQRARMRAALDYVRRTSRNAGLLVHVGQASRNHPNPDTARAAEELTNDALKLRLYSILALAYFCCRIAAPSAQLGSSSFVDQYERLRQAVSRLARLQSPTAVSSVESVL